MNTKTIKHKFIITFALILVFTASLSVYFANNTLFVHGAELIDNPFKTEYQYKDTIDVPEKLDVSYEGKTYQTKRGYIKFPNAKIFSAGKYTLDSYGNYTVIYEFDVDGEIETVEHSFSVTAATYTIGQNSEITTDTLNSNFGKDVSGLRVLLASGETLTYNNPINIYNGGVTELIKFNFMAFDPVVREAVIRLTDCYDPSVFVDIQYRKPEYGATYVLVGAYGKAAFGVWNSARGSQITKVATINGEECKINDKGTLVPSNRKYGRHPNAPDLIADRYNNITLSVDSSNKDKLRFYVNSAPEAPVNNIISELNNSDIYGYEFGGFTTGEVTLSVSVQSITGADYGEMEIASIAGLSGDDIAPSIVKDTTSPTLVINSESRMLNVMAGVEVTLPEAVAYDASGLVGEPECLVYYGYGTSFESPVEVKNGKFTPDYLGTYTVLYTVCDVFGNKTVEELVLNAVKTGSEGIEFSYEKITNAAAGQIVSFDNYNAKSLNSDVNVTVVVTDPFGKEFTLDSNKTFLLERAGKYKVKYVFYDNLYSGEQSYEFDCADKGLYRIDADKVYMPDYVIKGAEYSTDDVKAYKHGANAPEECDIKGYISYDDGEYKEINPDKFVIENASKLKIRLVCANDKNVFIESDEIKIIDVKYGTTDFNLVNYFAGDFAGSQSESTPDYTSYNLNNAKSGAIEFVNPLILSYFNFKFSLSQGTALNSFTVVLTDYYNKNNEIRIKFADAVTVNGREIRFTDNYVGSPVSITYDSSKTLSVGSSMTAFATDFTSEKVLLSVEFENITANGQFNVYSVCGQSFGYYVKNDTILPMVYAEGIERVGNIGDEITLPKPSFADVLSPSSRLKCTVSVYKDGVSVKSLDGTLLKEVYALDDYTFKIDGFGTYLIIYKYTDGAGRTGEARPTISVIDVVAPTIKLNGYNGTAVEETVNKTIRPLSYSVSDNVSSEAAIDVLIIVYNEKGIRVCVTRDSFVISKAGKYTVYICCFDEAQNSAYVTYNLIVK